MGLLNWLSGNKINSQVETIKINGQNINLNTSHVQLIEEIKIGIEVLVICLTIILIAIIIKKLYNWDQKRKTTKQRKLQQAILGFNSSRELSLATTNI